MPFESRYEAALIDALALRGASLVQRLRDNMPAAQPMACAGIVSWTWNIGDEAIAGASGMKRPARLLRERATFALGRRALGRGENERRRGRLSSAAQEPLGTSSPAP